MTLPFLFPVFTSVTDGGETGYEVHLNRSGINSIDVPRGKVSVEAGSVLRIRFLNRGAPIHITITSSNAGMFTDFFHENQYVLDESLLAIPIRKDCPEGQFDLELLSGYGAMKTRVPVSVVHPPPPRPTIREEYPLQPVAHGRPHLMMIAMGISLVLYCAWLYTKTEFLNIAAFIVLIVGALYTWYRQQ
jgi:hypothetical protein